MKITVIGAGIMGLSAAWALTRAGHRVTVYEQAIVPNPLGSSVDQHRLIRHAYGAERGYTHMVTEAYGAWEQVWRDVGARHYAASGTLVLETSTGSWGEDSAATLEAEGIAFRRLSAADVAKEFPLVDERNVRFALHLETGGTLFADRIVASLARWLEGKGAPVAANARVRDVDPTRARVTLENGTAVDADLLIVAAGPWASRLVPSIAQRVTPSRQVIVYVEPPGDFAAAWKRHPMILDIDPTAGFYLVPPRDGTGLKVGNHGFTLVGDPDKDRVPSEIEARAIMDLCAHRLRDFERYRLAEAKTCFYDVEPKERFIIEKLAPSAWIMSGFSGHGFKFGPVLGLELAKAIDGKRDTANFIAWAAGALAG
jgi:glycine/D-amino acid oxidase-like deaminating enzyme